MNPNSSLFLNLVESSEFGYLRMLIERKSTTELGIGIQPAYEACGTVIVIIYESGSNTLVEFLGQKLCPFGSIADGCGWS